MSKQSFMPRTDADKQLWLQNFANKLGSYATKYGIAAADVTNMTNSSAYFSYWLDYQNQFLEFGKKLTGFKNELRSGDGSGAIVPAAPTMGAAPTAVAPGIFNRASSLASVIKAKTNYTETDGKDLGIEGADTPPQNLNDAKPVISARLVNGGHPEIVWAKGIMDGIDIYSDRGNGQWIFIATDTYPNYIDSAPLPASGISALWQYRAIYRYDDAQVGQWSDTVSIAVTGVM